MLCVVVYDIVENRTRTRFHNFLKELGIHAQLSVFECRLDGEELTRLRRYCRDNLDLAEDAVRIYRVCERCYAKAVIQGQGVSFPNLEWAVV